MLIDKSVPLLGFCELFTVHGFRRKLEGYLLVSNLTLMVLKKYMYHSYIHTFFFHILGACSGLEMRLIVGHFFL